MGYADGRLTADRGEIRAAAETVRAALQGVTDIRDLTMKLGEGQGSLDAENRRARLVELILQAINRERLGHAEHTIARHPNGKTARRYYSTNACRLLWLITDPPTDGHVILDGVAELPDTENWVVCYNAPWQVTT